MVQQLLNIWEFFKGTLPVTFAFAAAGYLFGGLSAAVPVALTVGFAMSLFVKKYRENHHYIFYYNNGLTQLQLWIGSYLLTIFAVLLAVTLHVVIQRIL